ncbi:hypothetical protein [Streptomyces sp. Rer75]|uniref:hypothetical protein n=1 Tax=Streptomyces sp. Rer75 TaxID=2750011 RepID=UPI0015CFB07B|nr:hypothetical protein [Streptomyces sp. Rer75]QLH19305.1 hypothetical protein HYQ63_00165 [Streptomyces sp. Rer75]
MGAWEGLWVEGHQISRLRDGIDNPLLAAFQDEMLQCEEVSARDVFGPGTGSSEHLVYTLRGPGHEIAQRLGLLGFTREAAMDYLDELLEQERSWAFPLSRKVERTPREEAEREFLEGYSAADWVRDLREAQPSAEPHPFGFGEPTWLLGHLRYAFPPLALRAALLALPDAEVVMYVEESEGDPDAELLQLCSLARDALHSMAMEHAPLVVLTEGSTDVAILKPALELLYPHLTDLVRFMDYGTRPQGGAGGLVTTVRAFAAAGIANPVIALFDNDTAASEALRPLDRGTLPRNIKILQYPPLSLASSYPTLGPPSIDTPEGSTTRADVNGLAGSIELYLGRDALSLPDGSLRPVQWRSYSPACQQYQGEVTDKRAVQHAYALQLARAQRDPSIINTQDWAGVRAILDAVIHAFE